MMDDMLRFLNQLIQKDTNPRRRENIQRCKESVKEHGGPEEDYYIRVMQVVVKVLTEEEGLAIPPSPAKVNAFLLVSGDEAVSASFAQVSK